LRARTQRKPENVERLIAVEREILDDLKKMLTNSDYPPAKGFVRA